MHGPCRCIGVDATTIVVNGGVARPHCHCLFSPFAAAAQL
jgi:hypothetical protein